MNVNGQAETLAKLEALRRTVGTVADGLEHDARTADGITKARAVEMLRAAIEASR